MVCGMQKIDKEYPIHISPEDEAAVVAPASTGNGLHAHHGPRTQRCDMLAQATTFIQF